MNLKKKFIVVLAAGIMALSAAPFALAATPAPADNVVQEQQAEAVSQQNTSASNEGTELVNKRYLTKGGAAFWFIFTIVLNGTFSFWVGNRFYRLSRKDNHVTAEIRALRRDIDEKLVKNVGGFSEPDIDIKNFNENLSSDEEGIKPPEKQIPLRDISPEEEERFRKWEESQSKPKSDKNARPKSAVREELDGEMDDVKKINRKNYQPKRPVEETAPDDDFGETKIIKPMGEVKTKAKEIINDIFPFKED